MDVTFSKCLEHNTPEQESIRPWHCAVWLYLLFQTMPNNPWKRDKNNLLSSALDWIVSKGQKEFPKELQLERGQGYLTALAVVVVGVRWGIRNQWKKSDFWGQNNKSRKPVSSRKPLKE